MIGVILVGGGKGRRLGDRPKAFLQIARRPLLYYSLEKFYGKVQEIVVVLPREYVDDWQTRIAKRYKNVKVVPGGKHRQDSVKAGLSALKGTDGIVLIHDVARPFFSYKLLEKIIEGAKRYGAAVPYIEPQDTIKERRGDFVLRTHEREDIVCIQTPQGFKMETIIKAYREAYNKGLYATDDAALVERLGIKVYLVPGEKENIKLTYPLDIEIAKEILKQWKGAV
ncbi:MAG: 2-C-methyl-D-erythritol 4-phosphate cytidylyltransferase [Candidatus Ratteibacteria bacterium]|nr:2-C-methyl-D-erythritol 4-phosphate cytidylyltransferase [Candidatus Ratteibacteria bacterium]